MIKSGDKLTAGCSLGWIPCYFDSPFSSNFQHQGGWHGLFTRNYISDFYNTTKMSFSDFAPGMVGLFIPLSIPNPSLLTTPTAAIFLTIHTLYGILKKLEIKESYTGE